MPQDRNQRTWHRHLLIALPVVGICLFTILATPTAGMSSLLLCCLSLLAGSLVLWHRVDANKRLAEKRPVYVRKHLRSHGQKSPHKNQF